MKSKNYSVVILAAGLSERMGHEKFMLARDASATFVEHVSKCYYDFYCNKIIIVLNCSGLELLKKSSLMLPYNFQTAVNQYPENGRFFSLQTGLDLLSNEDFMFIHNIDNPFVNAEVLHLLLNNIHNNDFIYPTYKGKGGHPLLISRGTAQAIVAKSDSAANLKVYLKKFNGSAIAVDDPQILTNINTPEDYQRYVDETKNQKEVAS